jgi:hypothetical protein
MKKIGKIVKGNLKLVIGIIIGATISGVTVYAATVIASSNVSYSNTTSGLSATNVQSAIDELYTKASTWINPNNMGTPTNYIFDGSNKPTRSSPTTPPSGKNVYLGLYADSQYGVCIKRNGTQHCFRYKNWMAEKEHIQKVFSDVSCRVGSSDVGCIASDFYCRVYSNGGVSCSDGGAGENCYVNGGGSVDCG